MDDVLLGSNKPNTATPEASVGENSEVSDMSVPHQKPESLTTEGKQPVTVDKVPVAVTPEKATDATAEKPAGEEKPALSRREAIRARLREREARLTNLVRTTSTDSADSFIGQMRSVKENLEKVETEKSELEKELQRLKNATGDDEFLAEKMSGIQEGFMKQVKTIQKLEDEVVAKNNEIDHLRDELVSKLRRIVELEFDLETHDVHYTDYAAEQFKLGEDALTEIKTMERDELGDHSERSTTSTLSSSKRLSPRRAQKLISKLLADLDSLEARYKEEKLGSAAKKEKLQLENEELRTRIHTLEARLDEGEKAEMSEDSERSVSSTEMMNITFLRKRVETLEAKRALSKEEMKGLKKELTEVQEDSKVELKRASFEVDRLTLENDAMKARIRSLETDIMEEDPGMTHFAIIETKIREQYEDIAKLEAASEIKDRQIVTLKKDVTRLRMKTIAQTAGEKSDTGFSKFDAELIRDEALRGKAPQSTDGSPDMVDASLMRDIQRQLQGAQQQLVKKDQELVIERAKAASTAAGLLARITELSGKSKQVDNTPSGKPSESKRTTASADAAGPSEGGSKRRGKRRGKNTPLRFYL